MKARLQQKIALVEERPGCFASVSLALPDVSQPGKIRSRSILRLPQKERRKAKEKEKKTRITHSVMIDSRHRRQPGGESNGA